MTRILLLSFLVLATASGVHGREENADSGTLLRFAAPFGLGDANAESVALSNGKEHSQAFSIPADQFSAPMAPPKGDGLFIVIPAKDDQAGAKSRTLATITLPKEGTRFLVILLAQGNAPLRCVVLQANAADFKPGEVMIFNLSQDPFSADLGGTRLGFPPGSQTVFRPVRKSDDQANYQVSFYWTKGGRESMFAASLWPYFDDKRAFVFLHKDAQSGEPGYRAIDEFTDWLKD